MPLPSGGAVPWPPKHCEQINQQYATWTAWWAGDVEQLAGIYGGGASGDTTGFFASESGGRVRNAINSVVGKIRRWFWSSQASATQNRTRLHVPLAGDIATASSDLLFSEPPTITVEAPAPADGEEAAANPTQARLDELVDDGTHATLLEAAEICAAIGGVYLRIVWDPAVKPRPWITAVHPDRVVPEWKFDKLAAVTFWRVIHSKGKLVVRHLECHEPGKISHGVYAGTNDELGMPVPLTDYPATAGLANDQLVNGNEVPTGAAGLTAVYVPNMRPNRVWRNVPEAAHLGRSDYAGVEPLMDALDLVQSSWVRDVDLGKARLIVPREYLQSHGPGGGASLDLDREVYEGINIMSAEGSQTQLTQVQFKIRVEEHRATVNELKATIVANAGYSGQTFGLAADVAVTATEVAARERRSFITRDRKIRYWRPGLADILEALLQVDARWFTSGITPARPLIAFPDGVSIDPEAQARILLTLDQAGAISTEEKVRTLHPDWDNDRVAEEVALINGAPLEDPGTFTGGPAPGAVPQPGGPEYEPADA